MITLALDLSTKTGWAVFTGAALTKSGRFIVPPNALAYPASYVDRAAKVAQECAKLAALYKPDAIVIEETNNSKSRYTQKLLEFIHLAVLQIISPTPTFYINTSEWRRVLNVNLTPADKLNNANLSKAKKAGVSKKALGIKGKVTKKHVSVRVANARFSLTLKVSDNDIADAICVGAAYVAGCAVCTGK